MSQVNYPTFWQTVYEFQTLISGGLAILAAIATAWVILSAAKMPIRVQQLEKKALEQRRKRFVGRTMSRELKTVAARARMAIGTIRVHAASGVAVTEETKRQISFRFPELARDWESMSLLPADTFIHLTRVLKMMEDHNHDIDRSGGAFGADDFRKHLIRRLEQLMTTAMAVANQVERLANEESGS